MQVFAGGSSIATDPWFHGSTLWRSWWNYPPVHKSIAEGFAPDFIYLTHLHWDHFHGPSLRKLGLEKPIIIPKTPDTRIYKDLKDMGCTNIIELKHGESFTINEKLKITSFQFGYLSDSVLVIEADNKVLLNTNDAKIMGRPLNQVLKKFPEIDFVFRSHSSANSRLCYEVVDQGGQHIDDLDAYSKGFLDFCSSIGAKYAVPFASNCCYLHPDTFQYNKEINNAAMVKTYFDKYNRSNTECIILASGDWYVEGEDCFQKQGKDWYGDIERNVRNYQQENKELIERSIKQENRTEVSLDIIQKYFDHTFKNLLYPVRYLFKGIKLSLVCSSDVQIFVVELDVYARKTSITCCSEDEIELRNDLGHGEVQIRLHPVILQHCIRYKNWNSLGVSKRVCYRARERDIKYLRRFDALINFLDYEILPLRKTISWRFVTTWLVRWREVLLYLEIIKDISLRRGFVYKKYIPKNNFA